MVLQEAKKAMPLTSKINISPMLEEKPAPIAEEPTIYASKTVSRSFAEVFCNYYAGAFRFVITPCELLNQLE